LTLVIIHDFFLIKTTDHHRRRRPPSYHHHFDHHRHHYQQHHLKISYAALSFIIIKFQNFYHILIDFVINKQINYN
jgi:hypothetical protein